MFENDKKEIESIINELISSCGFKSSLSVAECRELDKLFDEGKFSKCIRVVGKHMKIPLKIKITYVNDHPCLEHLSVEHIKKSSIDKVARMNRNLAARMIEESAYLKANMAASIQLPEHMPIYGTKSFYKFTLEMNVGKSLLVGSYGRFVFAIAHEMSHVILSSLHSPFRKNEMACDLLPMVRGFSKIHKSIRGGYGSKLGYLSDRQFEIADQHIKLKEYEKVKRTVFEKIRNFWDILFFRK